SLRALPALNAGFLEALILIVSPVFGLRPWRAARLRTWKVPKPTSVTVSPFLRVLVMTLTIASTALAASVLDSSAASATAATKSPLFIRLDSLCGLARIVLRIEAPPAHGEPSTDFAAPQDIGVTAVRLPVVIPAAFWGCKPET